MKPIEFKHTNKVYAKDQPQYQPLPALELETGEVIACWKGNLLERLVFLFTGKMWVSLSMFGRPLTPSFVSVNRKEIYSHSDDKPTFLDKVTKLLNR